MAFADLDPTGNEDWQRSAAKIEAMFRGMYQGKDAQDMLGRSGFVPGAAVNFTAANLPKWTAARARVKAGGADAQIDWMGDSVPAGIGANAGNSGWAGSKVNAAPAVLSRALQARGLNSRSDGIFGANNIGSAANFLAYDPRNTFGTGWTRYADVSAPNGDPIYQDNASTGTWAIVVGIPFDRMRVRYTQFSAAGQLTVNVDGGAALTPDGSANAYINGAGTPTSMQAATFTVARGTHTVNLQRNGVGGEFRVLSIEFWDSTTSTVRVLNCGLSGAASATWLSASVPTKIQSHFTDVNAIKPDLSIIQLGINDWVNAVAVATYKSQLTTLVNAAKANGDVVLVVPNPTNEATISLAIQSSFRQAIYDIAGETTPVFDFMRLLGTYTDGNALGKYFDTNHPNKIPYFDLGSQMAEALMAA